MTTNDPVIIAEIVGFGVFLWLGLYLLVRASLRVPLILVTVAGLFGQATFFLASALTDAAGDPVQLITLERWTWWTSVLPLAIWFHLSCLLVRPVRQPSAARVWLPQSALVVYGIALLLIVTESATNLFNDYTDGTVRPGPAYPGYLVYQLLATAGALVNFVRARRTQTIRQEGSDSALIGQLHLLIVGSVLFLIGALWLGTRFLTELPISPLPGYLCLCVGVATLGYGVANYGMLLDGQNVQRDFLYTFTGITLLNLLYFGLLTLATQVSIGGALALTSLVTLTHTAFDSGRRLLDRLFFTQDEQTARAEAREFATALGTEPVTPVEPQPVQIVEQAAPDDRLSEADEPAASLKTFKNDVRRALTGLKSPPRLVNSPLLTLALVERHLDAAGMPDNRLNRVAALRELLIKQIEALRPEGETGAKVGEAWRFYNVLYYPYVRELSRKAALAEARRLHEERQRSGQRQPGDLEQVLVWLADVDEDTFYKWQRRASDAIATALWEQEQQSTAKS
jgi:hypothetical protein